MARGEGEKRQHQMRCRFHDTSQYLGWREHSCNQEHVENVKRPLTRTKIGIGPMFWTGALRLFGST
eukprot:scaffold157735_cov51-Attheya_sp.AAC.2